MIFSANAVVICPKILFIYDSNLPNEIFDYNILWIYIGL